VIFVILEVGIIDMQKLLVILFLSTFLIFGVGKPDCHGENGQITTGQNMTANTNLPTNIPEKTNNDEDYIPGVTPWHRPTDEELGFKPLSNTEFEKVKKHAAETKDERWSGLYPDKTTKEFDRDLAIEQDQLRKFENDYNDPPVQNSDVDEDISQPLFTWSFEDIGNFFKRLMGKK
jgi:hypothetical protein